MPYLFIVFSCSFVKLIDYSKNTNRGAAFSLLAATAGIGTATASQIDAALNAAQKEATEHTQKNQPICLHSAGFSDEREFEFATRGLIAAPNALEIKDEAGKVVWSQKAFTDFQKGEYQWVEEFTMARVFADPHNKEARYLCADALEQLGYQAESGVWLAAQ